MVNKINLAHIQKHTTLLLFHIYQDVALIIPGKNTAPSWKSAHFVIIICMWQEADGILLLSCPLYIVF